MLCGLLVVFNPFSRNPVTSAMFLVLTIISMSGLFVLLKAFFLAAVQILVYAGAVIVLFLFVIMLLDVKEEERRRYQKFGTFLGFAAVTGLTMLIINTINQSGVGHPSPAMAWPRPSHSANCCLPITCCPLRLSPFCFSSRWWAAFY